LEFVRKLWYRVDPYFEADTEHALFHDELMRRGREWFAPASVRYFGGPAYFLLLNSLLFRMPLKVAPIIERPLLALERLFNHLPGRVFFPAFAASWIRR
jgi:hypothetical protein